MRGPPLSPAPLARETSQSVSKLAGETSQSFGPTAVRALLLAAELVRDASAEAIQLHGAYGMTDRCATQRFYRRTAVDGVWLGTPGALRTELAGRLAARVSAG